MKTVLERAKWSALDIVSFLPAAVSIIMLFPPRAKQIRSLDFSHHDWADIRRFLESNSGPFLLLHTLRIYWIEETNPDALTPPSLLFSSAVNLQEFRLGSKCPPHLNYFIFPNVTLFELSVERVKGFHASQLLNFTHAADSAREDPYRHIV